MMFVPIFLAFLLFESVSSQRFVAAPKGASLRRRNPSIKPNFETKTLVYAEDSHIPKSGVHLSIEPKHPTLILDDIQEYIKSISCSESTIAISFHDNSILTKAELEWNTEALFITSHPSCVEAGEHGAYIVSPHSSHQESSTITLLASSTTIRKSTLSVSVDLGSHHIADDHRIVRRASSASISYTQYGKETPTESLSFTKPTAKAAGPTATGNIDFNRTNVNVLPPDKVLAALIPNPANVVGIVLGCKECSAKGNVALKAAGFKLHAISLESVVDFFEHGWVEFDVTGMSAKMEFQLDFLPGFRRPVFSAALPAIPLGAIDIAGIVTLGPTLNLNFPIAAILNSPINMTAGFTLDVPDSSIVLNVSDIGSSVAKGFQDTKLTPIPLSFSAGPPSMNLTAGFKPELLLSAGVDAEDLIKIDGGAGAFLDLPSLTATISEVKNVGADCKGKAAAGVENTFIQVNNSAKFDGGLIWQLTADIPDVPNFVRAKQVPLFTKVVPLSSQCLKVTDNALKARAVENMSSSNLGGLKQLAVFIMGLLPITFFAMR